MGEQAQRFLRLRAAAERARGQARISWESSLRWLAAALIAPGCPPGAGAAVVTRTPKAVQLGRRGARAAFVHPPSHVAPDVLGVDRFAEGWKPVGAFISGRGNFSELVSVDADGALWVLRSGWRREEPRYGMPPRVSHEVTRWALDHAVRVYPSVGALAEGLRLGHCVGLLCELAPRLGYQWRSRQ